MKRIICLIPFVLMTYCYQDLSKAKNGDGSSDANARVFMSETSTTLIFGTTAQLNASVLPNEQSVAWTSSNTNVATVSATGLVTAMGSGQAQIRATIGSAYATCVVTVPVGFSINPADGTTLDTTTLNTVTIIYS